MKEKVHLDDVVCHVDEKSKKLATQSIGFCNGTTED